MSFSTVLPLRCGIQKSAWGKRGSESTVAQLASQQEDFVIEEEDTYAELWMGAHPRFPSKIGSRASASQSNSRDDNPNDMRTLGEWITEHPHCLGASVREKFGDKLPFLLKVLSIEKALSIQAHPDKELAARLYKERPDIYPDPNHKPEMAIALTKFEGLCGFRPVEEILSFLHEVEEFLAVVGQDAVDALLRAEKTSDSACKQAKVAQALQFCFSCVMKCDASVMREQLAKLVVRLNECHAKREETTPYLGRLFLRLHSQFPGDVGCFVIYFLNHIVLQPFEAMYLDANCPHAYLAGDIVECMSASDNVVRGGFTSKYIDTETLCEMLHYQPQTPAQTKFVPIPLDTHTLLYNPPCDDFAVKRIQVCDGDVSSLQLAPVDGPSILLTLSGKAFVCDHDRSTLQNGDAEYGGAKAEDLDTGETKEDLDTGETKEDAEHACHVGLSIRTGSVLFIGHNEELRLRDISGDLLMFQAFCDVTRT